MIDWTKPIRTKERKVPARLLHIIAGHPFPYLVLFSPPNCVEFTENFNKDGLGLENVPEEITVWMVLLPISWGEGWAVLSPIATSKEDAEQAHQRLSKCGAAMLPRQQQADSRRRRVSQKAHP
jgi:hypothetical protein